MSYQPTEFASNFTYWQPLPRPCDVSSPRLCRILRKFEARRTRIGDGTYVKLVSDRQVTDTWFPTTDGLWGERQEGGGCFETRITEFLDRLARCSVCPAPKNRDFDGMRHAPVMRDYYANLYHAPLIAVEINKKRVTYSDGVYFVDGEPVND